MLLLSSSCSNDHCSEPMYAPLVVSFYSEIDTSRQVAPAYMAIEGLGTSSFHNVSGKDTIHLSLRKFEENSRFRFFTAYQNSPEEVWTYIEDRPNGLCPCETQSGYVPVYQSGETEIFICKEENPMLVVYRDSPSVYFLKERGTETLSAYIPTENILVINYKNMQEFISAECGCLVTHRLENMDFQWDGIGEIIIKDQSVNNKYDERHVNIYLENY
jgi:hypothetical protein